MAGEGTDFTLPIGFTDDGGNLFRTGTMRPATAGDELAIQGGDKVAFNPRYRDLELLARVVTRLGEKSPVTAADIEDLYEADFLYLQLLYQNLNGDDDLGARVACPHCGEVHHLGLPRLFEGMAYLPGAGDGAPAVGAATVEGE